MKKVKVGVAGVGIMGENHCKNLQKMVQCVEFMGVYDKNERKSLEIASKYNVRSYNSYKDLLNEVDAVIIATSSDYHFPLINEAIKYDIHLLVEKPFVTSIKEAENVESLLKDKQLIFQVGHIERFNPAIQNLDKVITPNNILTIEARRIGQVQRNIDIDVILNLMIHDIDIVLNVVKSPLKKINAEGVSFIKEKELDIVYAVLTFENGIIANLVANRLSKEKTRTLTVTEQNKVIKADNLTRNLYIYPENHSRSIKDLPYKKESIVEKVLIPRDEPLYSEIDHFIYTILMNKKPIVGIKEAINSLKVALDIKEYILKNM